MDNFQAGRYEKQYEYSSFLPSKINREWTITDQKTLKLLEDATLKLGELNAYSKLVPDVDFFIQMHLTKEATTSSRIEGTRTNMEEALILEEDIDPDKRDDWQEIQNYIKAINHAISRLKSIPLSNRLLRGTHKVLMQGVRGKEKQPGEFRKSQNWIGVSLKNATFVPPHHAHVPELMADLEKFMHNDELHVPHLIKCAIIHYQFETIHPFLDGNGRLGRLLIVLYLVGFDLLRKPALYLSDFFERHKDQYFDLLMAVRQGNKIDAWLHFFLIGVGETATNSIQTLRQLLAMKERIEREQMPTFHARKRDNARQLMAHLYQHPVISVKDVESLIRGRVNTASALVKDFMDLGILREITGQQRYRLFVFDEYVRLFIR